MDPHVKTTQHGVIIAKAGNTYTKKSRDGKVNK